MDALYISTAFYDREEKVYERVKELMSMRRRGTRDDESSLFQIRNYEDLNSENSVNPLILSR